MLRTKTVDSPIECVKAAGIAPIDRVKSPVNRIEPPINSIEAPLDPFEAGDSGSGDLLQNGRAAFHVGRIPAAGWRFNWRIRHQRYPFRVPPSSHRPVNESPTAHRL